MKRRHLYVLLFSVPALLASVIISFLLFGAAAGVFWIFVFGDNPWPSSASNLLTAVLLLACVILWVALMSVAYVAGKRQEEHTALNARHVLASAGATALLALLVVLHQWGVGNIGAKPDGALCSAFCRDKGYAGSSMPPRDAGALTCSCFDAQGRKAMKVPMGDVTVEQEK